jgi:two-component system response regulator PilR (NtrC family)
MPALRERLEDIPAFVAFFIERIAGPDSQAALSKSALEALGGYSFPGNVRELENILERALALSDSGVIEADELNLTPTALNGGDDLQRAGELSLQDYLDRVERDKIMLALEQTKGNKTAAARVLGVTFRSLRYRVERLGIE